MLSDEQLMHDYQQGDYMAFEALYNRHKGRVFAYLNKRITNKSVVNDLFQEIFFKLHRSQKSYDDQRPFLPWLYTICKTQILDYLRKNKITEIELKDFMIEHQNSDSNEIDLDSFPSLNPKERQAIDLRFNSDKDYQEISEALQVSAVNGRKIVSRALGKIKKTILKRGSHGEGL